jgi:hypothetical protein
VGARSDASRRSTFFAVSENQLSVDQQALLDRATQVVWKWERARFQKVFAGHLRNNTKFARAIPTSGLEVTALSVAGLIWLRTATLFAILALAVGVAGANGQEHSALLVTQAVLWALCVADFALALVKIDQMFRFKRRSARPSR